MTDNESHDQEQQITSIADAVVKLKELRESNKNLNEPDIEEKFARLSLAFKTDRVTLGKRLDLQLRQRDIAEKNIDGELKALRESLNALNQLCTESDMRDVITKTQQHVDIVQQATMRMSSRAETYGAIQQEQRMNCAFETMLNYVEHLKLLYDKEHLELEDYRKLLAEHNLLPDEKNSTDEDSRHVHLPPRSQSLSGTSRPESRTRLLSAVCVINNNNNHDSGPPGNPGSMSPKSRRSSLPVGPLAQSSSNPASHITRAHNIINEKQEISIERRDSKLKLMHDNHSIRQDSEESSVGLADSDNVEDPHNQPDVSEDNLNHTNSGELKLPLLNLVHMDSAKTPKLSNCLSQESACDNATDDDVICLLPELKVPVMSKPLYLLGLLRRVPSCRLFPHVSSHRVWRVSHASVVLHARYTLSAALALAAMLTLVITFLPNCLLSHLFGKM